MSSDLFRKKSIERVSSPEQLNDYVKVSSPGIWAVLAAVLILLAGAFVWGSTGKAGDHRPSGGHKPGRRGRLLL